MVITLIGYRGCGKSSIAPRLAKRLEWNWIDSDRVIEERAGCSIRQIFENEGEVGFRQRESEIIAELLKQDHPHIHYADGTRRGYTSFALDAKQLVARQRVVANITAADAAMRDDATYAVEHGRAGPRRT